MGTYATPGALTALPDGALIALVAARDQGAFETLVRRHEPSLLRACMAILHNAQDAEEAVQAAMFKAYMAIGRGVRMVSVQAWLMTVARNECSDLMRRRPRTERLPRQVRDPSVSPAERAEQREALETLRGDLAALPKAQRTAIVLRGMADLRHADIARRLGVSPAAARTLVHEARSSLAEFGEGRAMSCSLVVAAIDGGDRRQLRARRIRAHLRACEGCRVASAQRPTSRAGRLAGLLPTYPVAGWVRALLGTGQSVGDASSLVAVAAGTSLAIGASLAVVLGGGSPGGGADRPVPAQSTTVIAGSATGTQGAGPGAAEAPAWALVLPPGGIGPSPGVPPTGVAGAPYPTAPAGGPGSAAGPSVGATIAIPGAPAVPSVAVPAVAVPGVAVAPVAVPGVTVPGVAVPPVAVPGVTVPGVAVPPIAVPRIAVPPVVVPPVAVPPVVVPPVPVPAVPALPLPGASVDDLPVPQVRLPVPPGLAVP